MFNIPTVLLLLFSAPATACSLASCIDHGIELRRGFIVAITLDGKPLRGVAVAVTRSDRNSEVVRFSGVTTSDGTVHVTGLTRGEYRLSARLLGIDAADQCFHIGQRPSTKAKHQVTYTWGDFAPTVSKIAGTLIDSQPGTGGTIIWNLTHRVSVPIRGAKLRLQNAMTGDVFNSTSDKDGAFEFKLIPKAIYVLHIEGGEGGRDYDPTDLPIELSPKATRSLLVLMREEGGAGSCGGHGLALR